MRQLVYTSLRLIIMPHFTKENLPNHQKVSKYYQHHCSLFILHKTCSKQYAEETTDHFRLSGIILKLMTESLREGNIVCKNICISIFIVMAIMVSLRMLK